MRTSEKVKGKISRKPVKRAVLAVLGAILIILIGSGFWLSLPTERIPVASLLPSSPFAYLTVKLDRKDPAIAGIAESLKGRLGAKSGFIKRQAINLLLPAALPPSVSIAVSSDARSDVSSLVVFADMGRLSKPLRLFGSSVAGRLLRGKGPIIREIIDGQVVWSRSPGKGPVSLSAYAIIGGTIVLGTSRNALLDVCARYSSKNAPDERRASWGAALTKATAMAGAYFYAENKGGDLTRLVNGTSAKYSFAAFPSIDAVSAISGSCAILESAVNGQLVIRSSSVDQGEAIRSDIQFIYGAVKRVARSAGFKMQGEAVVNDGGVVFSFSLPGYREALSASEKKL